MLHAIYLHPRSLAPPQVSPVILNATALVSLRAEVGIPALAPKKARTRKKIGRKNFPFFHSRASFSTFSPPRARAAVRGIDGAVERIRKEGERKCSRTGERERERGGGRRRSRVICNFHALHFYVSNF